MGDVSGLLPLKVCPCSPRSGVYVVPRETPCPAHHCPGIGTLHQALALALRQEVRDEADDFLQL